MALKTARDHLTNSLATLQEQRERLQAQANHTQPRPQAVDKADMSGCSAWIFIAFGVAVGSYAVISSFSSRTLPGNLMAAYVAALVTLAIGGLWLLDVRAKVRRMRAGFARASGSSRRQLPDAKATPQPTLAELDRQIEAVKGQIAEITARMDRLSMQI